MEEEFPIISLPIQSQRLFHPVSACLPTKDQPLNIFRSQKKLYSFDSEEKPVGGDKIIKRINQSFLRPYSSKPIKRTTLSTKENTTILQESKMKMEFCSIPIILKSNEPREQLLKRDGQQLSIEYIRPVHKRILTAKEKPTIYSKNIRPFLQVLGQKSMTEYTEQLVKKYGNRYFEKILRNSYKDDPSKKYTTTFFQKEQKQQKRMFRKKIISSPFFMKHQFMYITGQNKKEKESRAQSRG